VCACEGGVHVKSGNVQPALHVTSSACVCLRARLSFFFFA
jgi:hypothetical protein